MRSPHLTCTLALLATAGLVGARACDGSGGRGDKAPPQATSTPSPAPSPGALAELLPGIPLESLTPPQREVAARVAQDEFCYCGCPHTLSGCLREHKPCRHAPRMAALTARLAAGGLTQPEILKVLTEYYASFDKAKRIAIDLGAYGPPRGRQDAPVTLVEYSDFTCPFCGVLRPMLEQFLEQHAGRVKMYYKPFPLASHEAQHAFEAAEAVEWGREKGVFWRMHDLLFENAQDLAPASLARLARDAGADPADLGQALASRKFKARVQASLDEGHAAGLQGTPTLFFNGRRYTLPDISPAGLEFSLADEEEWAKGGGWSRD